MLSILIPVFNYNAVPLVEALHEQIIKENIVFEIIVADDASTDLVMIKENQTINQIPHCQYHFNVKNLGRGENRNALCAKAKYPWVLLLDCDTLPTAPNFIKNYCNCMKDPLCNVFYGGITYQKSEPKNDALLRWIYGIKREAIPFEKRQQKPYESTLVSNILIQKEILLQHPFHSLIYDYGFEDFVFIATLKKNNIKIGQIDNAVYHLNLEKSAVFLKKHLVALDNLHALIAQKIIHPNETTLSKWQATLKRFKLDRFIVWLFNIFEAPMKRKIISNKPSLLLFDFYKLGYFCALKYS
ncbi:glycosyltransferase [Flavobacterium sp.]|uniref:glycosyltransferase family 2 protein n=1 Tax=Flavobacterium sp. TaxID=239 RepID=UPI00286B7A26|nr:glycosyltransferase [Flavobacterium sp.]